MLDFGFDELAVIGAVALVVIGPQKLPRVARTVGALLGKAQRYVSDVKAEVNRSIELEELQKMKGHVESAARDMSETVQREMGAASQTLSQAWAGNEPGVHTVMPHADAMSHASGYSPGYTPVYKAPKKNWRAKRGAVPLWFKQRQGVRTHAQSGAARVARFRPRPQKIT